EKKVVCAINGCSKLFCSSLAVAVLDHFNWGGQVLASCTVRGASYIRRYCCHLLQHAITLLLGQKAPMQESALCSLIKFASTEGKFPLHDLDWIEHYSFPRKLIQAVVEWLLSQEDDMALLVSRFQDYLDMEDVRHYVLSSVRENVSRVMDRNKGAVMPIYQNNVFTLLSNVNRPSQSLPACCCALCECNDHLSFPSGRHTAFERSWLGFLKYKLPNSMYKKVLVILCDSILPHIPMMLSTTPFVHCVSSFSQSHLPVYLVAAFAKGLSHLALKALPAALLMVLPFIYNLIRLHPACRVLTHRPKACVDPYLMEEEDPTQCHTLLKHCQPDVAKAAMAINKPLSQQEDDISEVLDLSTYEQMEQDLKQSKTVPLEFDPAIKLLEEWGYWACTSL
uniref:CCAAT-binding factor domain-containing protein n=1 Tax=Oncorhynchus mykiss TaxID=8022 RepID=A0A8C7URF6_ONCMY